MKKIIFNFSFLDRFKKDKTLVPGETVEQHQPESEPESEYEAESEWDETPEDFAEKSLSTLNLDNFRINPHQTTSKDLPHPKDDLATDDLENPTLVEMNYKKPPPVANKFKLNFNFKNKIKDFNQHQTQDKFKSFLKNKLNFKNLEKFSWNDFIFRLFSPYSRDKIHALFIIFLVVVFTYTFGKSLALFFNSSTFFATSFDKIPSAQKEEKVDTTLMDINKISATNLFNVKESDKAVDNSTKKNIASIICNDATIPTNAPIKLVDTVVLQDYVKSVASVSLRGSSELLNIREGERLDETMEVAKIKRAKLILKNLQTGDCEYAGVEEETETAMPNINIYSPNKAASLFKSTNPNIKNDGNNFKIKRAFRDSMIGNLSDILTQAKAIQITNPDGSLQFKMTEIVPGSVYSLLDIQENDVISSINGKKIENLNELMNLLGKIKEIDHFQIGMMRNGMLENKEYNFD